MIGKIIYFYWGRGIAYIAPALAFYLLLLLPSLLLGFAAIGSLLGEISAEQITPLVTQNFAPSLRSPIEQFARIVFSGQVLLVSVPLMLWTLSAVLSLIERVLSRSPQEPWDFVKGRLRLLLLSLVIVLLLLLLLFLSAVVLPPELFFLLPFPALLLLYRLLPRCRPSWRRAAEGALPAAALLLLSPRIFALWIEISNPSLASGLVATLLLLLSCYFISFALLLGAGIASRETYKL